MKPLLQLLLIPAHLPFAACQACWADSLTSFTNLSMHQLAYSRRWRQRPAVSSSQEGTSSTHFFPSSVSVVLVMKLASLLLRFAWHHQRCPLAMLQRNDRIPDRRYIVLYQRYPSWTTLQNVRNHFQHLCWFWHTSTTDYDDCRSQTWFAKAQKGGTNNLITPNMYLLLNDRRTGLDLSRLSVSDSGVEAAHVWNTAHPRVLQTRRWLVTSHASPNIEKTVLTQDK